MSETVNLGLGLVAAGQAQKHVTVNEALTALDAVVQIGVLGRGLTGPPDEPAPGDRHIPAAGAGGAWEGHDGEVAAFQDGAWRFYPPRTGWLAYVADEQVLIVWDGAAWAEVTASGGGAYPGDEVQNLALLGIGTEADAVNPFAAKLNKALWTARTAAEGGDGDLRYTLVKEGETNFVSLLFQSGYQARAEMGLLEDDDLTFKVSADGIAWHEALVVASASGRVALPGGLDLPGLGLDTKLLTQPPAYGGAPPVDPRLAAAMLAAGAMVEYGSNANGRYWRWESGLQICAHQVRLATISTSSGAGLLYENWTFPAAFLLAPTVTGTVLQGSLVNTAPHWREWASLMRRAATGSGSGFTVWAQSTFAAGNFIDVEAMATGMWK